MIVIAVDDEQIALDNLKLKLKDFSVIRQITTFNSPNKALDWLMKNKADIAFLDINMQQMNGLTLAKNLKIICPGCAVIFVTGYSDYAVEAFRLHASGYLMKPIRKEDIQAELDFILNPPSAPVLTSRLINVRCFGSFEVFVGDEQLEFKYSKTKELLAYLIDRKGAFCSNSELMTILWGEHGDTAKRSSYLRDLKADLLNTFKGACGDGAIKKQRGMIAVIPDRVKCDYYAWLKGELWALNAYKGEYMTQYSWGEFTLGGLEMHTRK